MTSLSSFFCYSRSALILLVYGIVMYFPSTFITAPLSFPVNGLKSRDHSNCATYSFLRIRNKKWLYIVFVVFPFRYHQEEICAPNYDYSGNQGGCGRKIIYILPYIWGCLLSCREGYPKAYETLTYT